MIPVFTQLYWQILVKQIAKETTKVDFPYFTDVISV
jgi:hypothetical protein